VLFADVVGFTRLSERSDPETVREIMDGCFDVLSREIERYGGTVNTFTGDGLMALFGAPVAHEDHAARAVHAAWAIQQAMAGYADVVLRRWEAPFQLRLGLHTGLVVIGAVGDFAMEFTAMGDTVNLAARLQAAAPPGGIWVSEATSLAVGAGFAWRAVGPLALKGKSEPVDAYEVTGLGVATARFEVLAQRGLTRFVGRDAELDRLLAAWKRARDGAGQVVSVVGEAGLGKSRLLYEFKTHLAASGASLCEGSCFAYGDITPYLPFLDVIRAFEAIPDDDMFIGNLLGHPVEDEFFARLPAPVVRQRTVEAVRDLLLAEAAAGPLVVVLEDVHWIDSASQEVLSAVVEAMSAASLLVVLAYRPEYLHAWADTAYHAEISLTRLGDASSAAMVRAILNKPFADRVALERFSAEQSHVMLQNVLGTAGVPPELEDLVADRTDGNPLFVEELVRSLLESGDLTRHGPEYLLTRPLEKLVVPTSVQGVLIERVDRLNPDLKALLQAASVLGRVFTYPLLSAVAQRNGALDRGLLELEDLEFIYTTSLAPEREYSFKHVLTQEAVYGTLLRSRREAYHERAGQALEMVYPDRLEEFYERLAYHYTRSANVAKALDYLELANRKTAAAYAMAEAKRYFDDAMVLLDTLPDTAEQRRRRVALVVDQNLVFFFLYLMDEYLELLYAHETAVNELGDLSLLGMFYAHLGEFQLLRGDVRGMESLRRAVAAAEAGGHVLAAGMAYSMLTWGHFWSADYEQVATCQAKALHAFEERFDLTFCMHARTAAAFALSHQGRWRDAIREGEQALELGHTYRDDSVVSFSAAILAQALASQGAVEQAVHFGRLAVDKARTPFNQLLSQSFLGFALCRHGQVEEAVEVLAGLQPMFEGGGIDYAAVFNGLYLGEAYWRAGRHAESQQALATAIARAESIGMRWFAASARRILGEVTDDEGHFEGAIAVLQEIGAENELALAYAGYGQLLQQQGRTDEARGHLTLALEIFERLGTQLEPDRVREALRDLE
jgi:class 3 adenylate cyclase/tetratricopeptide (TPR) repeat protein